jgi:hypothetical protein
MFLYPQMDPGVFNPLQAFHTLLRTNAPAGYPNTGWGQPSPWAMPYMGGMRPPFMGWTPYLRNYGSPLRMQITAPPRLGPLRGAGWMYGSPVRRQNQGFAHWRGLRPFGFGMYANQMLSR